MIAEPLDRLQKLAMAAAEVGFDRKNVQNDFLSLGVDRREFVKELFKFQLLVFASCFVCFALCYQRGLVVTGKELQMGDRV